MPKATNLARQIAARILDQIRAAEWQRGHHLPTQALADACQVSRAPVTSALELLEAMGVVRSERNRGYFLAQDANQLARTRIEDLHEENEDALYFQMAEDRLRGKLPEQVTENELMRRYDIPRGQLLKTLNKMTREGWVSRLPGHGWQFRPTLTSRTSYEAGYRFRAAIESAAVLEPTYVVDARAFGEARRQQQMLLEGSYRRLSRAQLFLINSEFHETIVRCANNEFFLESLRRVNRLRRLIEYRVTLDRTRLPQQCREHLKILDLLEAGDFAAASLELRKHIDGARGVKSPDVDRHDA